ncbi:hypothetical protein NMG60_11006235 [Bertholletia excelsa]
MKFSSIKLPSGKSKQLLIVSRNVVTPLLSLAIIAIPLSIYHTSPSFLSGCNVFKGNWVPYTGGPYYTNETKCVIDDRQNCMKFGRPDMEFLKWRWKPHECELPLFDAVRFLALVRGKTMAFLGDSVGRNQMQSLVCMLSSVSAFLLAIQAAQPVDVSSTYDTRFRRWHYPDHNFTITALWSPLLVKSHEPEPTISPRVNLYLDEPDQAWSAQIEGVDIVVISAGQWFFRPFVYYQKGKPIACYICNNKGKMMREFTNPYFGYRMAFRTVFRTLLGMEKFRGLTFLRAFSPAHFEHGKWNEGGGCERTRPFTTQEMKLNGFNLEFYKAQVKELRAAERRGKKRGLKFRLLDTTAAMVLRPDGHPSRYGHRPEENKTTADCVHWCMPGPVDTWSEFLLHMLKVGSEAEGLSSERKLLELK